MTEKDFVDRFLSDVFDPVISDLRQMLLQPKGLDFGIIILICSGIELMGTLDYGSLSNKYYKRFNEALIHYFPIRYAKYPETLYYQFRCGLAHQAFIKPGTATARNPDYRQLHLWGVQIEGEADLLLFVHPDEFAEDFFNAINKFKDSLKADRDKVGRVHQAIEAIYGYSINSNEPIQPHLYLTDDDSGVTRQPMYKWLRKSEVTMGSIKSEDKTVKD